MANNADYFSYKVQIIMDKICSNQHENLKTLILDQIKNLSAHANNRRYTPGAMMIYMKIFLYSPKIYRYLSNNTFIFPTERHLRRYIFDLPTDVTSFSENKKYLAYKFGQLRSHEKLFVLMIDEIHITAQVNIHTDYGTAGMDHIDPNNTAKAVIGFMVKSIFGKYQKIIALIPSFKGTTKSLYDLTLDVLKLIHELGGTVITIITDNNRVNIKLFKTLNITPQNSHTKSPVNDSEIFALYDSVHLFKNFRNNWLNKKDNDKTIEYYDVDEIGVTTIKRFAKFSHLIDLFRENELAPLTISSKLTLKSLVPSNLDRQKVSLALKIFCFENVAGLRYLADKKDKPEYLDTAIFIEKFVTWFDILNVKTPDKGANLKNVLLDPIRTKRDSSLEHLRVFGLWLMSQRPLRNKFLTGQTFDALYLTNCGVIRCVEYLLDHGYSGVLLGVFQTDPLEKRFGLFRLTQGSNYHINPQSLFQSEKKLRISSIIDLSESLDSLTENFETLKQANRGRESNITDSEVLRYSRVVFSNWTLRDTSITEQSIVYYITGYCAFKIVQSPECKQCIDCKNYFKGEKINGLCDLIDQHNKGNLCYPTLLITEKVFKLDYIMNVLCFHQELSKSFLKPECPKYQLIIKLFETQIDIDEIECESGHNLKKFIKKY